MIESCTIPHLFPSHQGDLRKKNHFLILEYPKLQNLAPFCSLWDHGTYFTELNQVKTKTVDYFHFNIITYQLHSYHENCFQRKRSVAQVEKIF